MIRCAKIKGNIKNKIPRLVARLRKVPQVNAALLFGSYARGEVKSLSDIDIAVLLDRRLPKRRYWDYKLKLSGMAMKALGTDELDFVILNEAPCDIAFNILKEGTICFCRDEEQMGEYREKAVLRYFDTQPIREELRFHALRRAKTGRFGDDQEKH